MDPATAVVAVGYERARSIRGAVNATRLALFDIMRETVSTLQAASD